MNPARDLLGRVAVIDVETTGLDPARAHVIEVGAVFVEPGAPLQRRSWLVRPPVSVPAFITALTGLDDAALEAALPFDVVAPELTTALRGWTLIAHNASFERSFLGRVVDGATFIDSCVLMHLLAPELPSHALDALVRWAGIGGGAKHRALGDAEDTLRVLEVAVDRLSGGRQRAALDALTRQLESAEGPEGRALLALLSRLQGARGRTSASAPSVDIIADAHLERLLEEALADGAVVGLEVERAGVVAAALQVARRRAGQDDDPLVLSVPRGTLRELAASSPLPIAHRQPTCRRRLEALLAQPGATDGERLARAYLSSLLLGSPLLTPSRWFTTRAPEVAALLQAAGPCRCEDAACALSSGAAAEARAVLVSHELALDWLERRVPMALLALDAEQLLAAARARAAVHLDRARLEHLAGALAPDDPLTRRLRDGARALEDAVRALAAAGARSVELHARVQPPWLALRDVLSGLRKDTSAWLARQPADAAQATPLAQLAEALGRLAEPPPPGLAARLQLTPMPALSLELQDAEAAVRALLPRAAVLVTGSVGGLGWASADVRRVGPVVRPSVELEPCAAGEAAAAESAGRLALRLGGPVALIAEGPLEPYARALRAACPHLPIRTVPGAPPPRGACVTLVPWPGGSPPDALATLIGPVRDVRRAALACGDRDVTVLTSDERWAAHAAVLADLRRGADLAEEAGSSPRR